MILSYEAFKRIRIAIHNEKIIFPYGRSRNDVEIIKWANLLNIKIIHNNLFWGDAIPESNDFYNENLNDRNKIRSAIRGVITLHKMCPNVTCSLMYQTFHVVKQAPLFYSIST